MLVIRLSQTRRSRQTQDRDSPSCVSDTLEKNVNAHQGYAPGSGDREQAVFRRGGGTSWQLSVWLPFARCGSFGLSKSSPICCCLWTPPLREKRWERSVYRLKSIIEVLGGKFLLIAVLRTWNEVLEKNSISCQTLPFGLDRCALLACLVQMRTPDTRTLTNPLLSVLFLAVRHGGNKSRPAKTPRKSNPGRSKSFIVEFNSSL